MAKAIRNHKVIETIDEMVGEINSLIRGLDPDDVKYKTIDLPEGVGFAIHVLQGVKNCLTAAMLYLER